MPSPIRRLGYAVDHFTAESTQMGFEGGGNDSIAGDASTSGTRSAEADAEAAGPTRVGGAGRAQATTPKMSANAEYPMRMLPLFVECLGCVFGRRQGRAANRDSTPSVAGAGSGCERA